MTLILRDYQEQLRTGVYNSWNAGNRNVLAVSVTGSGKSKIMSKMADDFYRSNQTPVILAHRNELVSQMSCHIAELEIPHRIVGSKQAISRITHEHREKFGRSFINPSSNTAVIGVDTMIARADDLKDWARQVDVWFLDESHHCVGSHDLDEYGKPEIKWKTDPNKWAKAVSMFTNARGVGFTATPQRADGQGLGRDYDGLMDDMIIGPSMRHLIDREFLADYEIVCPTSDLNTDDSPLSKNGDWTHQTLRKAAKKSHIVGDTVENYCKYALGKSAIVFATDIETSNEIAQKFNDWGIPAASLHGKTNPAVRDKYLREFQNGKTKILVNVDLFDEGFDCLDVETEILTPNGWKNYLEIQNETECFAWNSRTDKAEIVPILKKGVRSTREDEKILTIKSQHTDVKVTEGHRFYGKNVNYYLNGKDGLDQKVFIKTAKDIFINKVQKFALPISTEMTFDGIPLKEDEIRVLGWYMTDGYLNKNNILEISQVKKHHIKTIREILTRLNYEFKEKIRVCKTAYKENTEMTVFYVPRRNIQHLLPYMDKKNPPKLLNNMTKEQFKILWGSMMDGNGSRSGVKAGVCCTMFKGQADFITAMASVRGFATMYGTYQTKNNVTMYNMRIRESKWMKFYQKDKRGARFELKTPEKPELVWCVTNKLGTIITRRNGKVIVLGNCPSCSVVILARPTASLGKYLQMVGRALRYMPGKVALIIDQVSNIIRHRLPDQERVWTLARREKKSKKTPDPDEIPLKTCHNCTKPYEQFLICCPYCGAEKPLPSPSSRTLEMVEGDLILLDREALAALRAKTVLENPADIAERVAHASGNKIAGQGAAKRQLEKIEAHERLSEAIAQWAAVKRQEGRNDREIQKMFYHTLGFDVVSALDASRKRVEMDKLSEIIEGWVKR